jgi:hypothetical protein
MDDYQVIDSDSHTIGHVVGEQGNSIIVERGTLRKHRHALPRTFVEVDEAAGVVRTTLSKKLIEDSPEVDDDGADEHAIAAYYGLAGGFDQPDTLGYGEIEPDETAISAELQTRRVGIIPPEEKRAQMRNGHDDVYGPPGRQLIPPDPHEDVPGSKT